MRRNHDLLSMIYSAIIEVMASFTSYEYAVITMRNELQKYINDYPFVKFTDVNYLSDKKNFRVILNPEIDTVQPIELARFITKLISSVTLTDNVKDALMNELRTRDYSLMDELQALGVML